MTTKKNQRSKGNNHGKNHYAVRIEFNHPAAGAVAIAGTFNDWRPEAAPMARMADGRWVKELVLSPGSYEYLFVADGHWVVDPLAPATVANPFGGINSVIMVPADRNGNGRPQIPSHS